MSPPPATWWFDDDNVDVRTVQPYQATKAYRCPGCDQDIPSGTFHIVAVPRDEPDLRRHWHRGCWDARHRRGPRHRRPG